MNRMPCRNINDEFTRMKQSFLVVVFILTLMIGCIPPVNEIPPNPRSPEVEATDAFETMSNVEYYSIFIEALNKTGVDEVLRKKGPYTVFAPRSESFPEFFRRHGIKSLNEIPDDELTEILLHHISPGEKFTYELKTGYYPTLARESSTGNPIDLFIHNTNRLTLNNTAIIGTSDIEAGNGVIQSVIGVMDLPDVLMHLQNNPEFSLFLKMIDRLDNKEEYHGLLTGNEPVTLFVPAREALGDYLNLGPGENSLEKIPVSTLKTIIHQHMVKNVNVVTSELYHNQKITSINKYISKIQKRGSKIFVAGKSGSEALVLQPDIQAVNGIIHTIDKVLIAE